MYKFMEDYEKLLDSAYENIKVVEGTGERFEVPEIEGFFQGKKTVLTNFNQIASHIRREAEDLQKFLSKELAVQINKERDKFVLGSKISRKRINPKIRKYVDEFVICKNCGKPDTQLVKQDKTVILHCLACGAKNPLRSKI